MAEHTGAFAKVAHEISTRMGGDSTAGSVMVGVELGIAMAIRDRDWAQKFFAEFIADDAPVIALARQLTQSVAPYLGEGEPQ